ncbi:hypothetical protein B0H11DRAFT_2063106 [Mycena galericulata]|nr:hypothetical protein B0H11DRAFT_2063106 [Mycena galericulata]
MERTDGTDVSSSLPLAQRAADFSHPTFVSPPKSTSPIPPVFQTSHYPLTMPSFSQLALLATAAFAGFAAAAPVAASQRDLVALPAILTQLSSDLGPVTDLLSSIDLSNATAEVVTPLTSQVQSILAGAVSQIGALAGNPVGTILATADGAVATVEETAQLLANPLSLVTGALGDVLAVVDSTPAGAIITPLLNDASAGIEDLLTTVAPLVNGLLATAAPLIAPVVGVLNDLGLGPVVGLLGGLL